jgi:transposase
VGGSNVLGALDFVSKKVETITNTGYITATEVIALIDKLCTVCSDLPKKLVMDNARYQHCKAVIEHAAAVGVELIFLPTYSPNLNLIERLWKFVKGEVLNAAYHPQLPENYNVVAYKRYCNRLESENPMYRFPRWAFDHRHPAGENLSSQPQLPENYTVGTYKRCCKKWIYE